MRQSRGDRNSEPLRNLKNMLAQMSELVSVPLLLGSAPLMNTIGVVEVLALEVVALEIEFLCLPQSGFRQTRMLTKQYIAERRPEPLVLPARVRTSPEIGHRACA
jgi:hypothetical protein